MDTSKWSEEDKALYAKYTFYFESIVPHYSIDKATGEIILLTRKPVYEKWREIIAKQYNPID